MVNPIDLMPQGDPETVVCLPDGDSLIGLYVKDSGLGAVMLGIREDCLGRPVACAIANDIKLDITPHRYRNDADYHKGAVGE